MRRRRGAGSRAVVFVVESLRDAADAMRTHRALAVEAARVSIGTGALAGLVGAGWCVAGGESGEALRFLGWCVAGGAATALLAAANARLFVSGTSVRAADARIGLANVLTLARFALIAPTLRLLLTAHYAEAAVVYGLLTVTDVADGVVARARRETTEFGVIMDPLADIASTFAVFSGFVVDNLIPVWLYLLLIARYAMMLVGSLVLFLATGPIEFRATVPGKVVGVVQTVGTVWIMVAAAGGKAGPARDGLLFAFLGLGFASIVVSQAFMGWRYIRRVAPRGGGWQGGSTR